MGSILSNSTKRIFESWQFYQRNPTTASTPPLGDTGFSGFPKSLCSCFWYPQKRRNLAVPPPFWNAGGSFWQLWGTLAGNGSSRKDTLGSGDGLLSIGFRLAILKLFYNFCATLPLFCQCLFPGSFLYYFLVWINRAWKTSIWCKRVGKKKPFADIGILLI